MQAVGAENATDAVAQSVAAAGWAAMTKGRRVKVVGGLNKLFVFFPRLAPRAMVTFMAGIFLKKR